jgi:hypothetical protein
MKKLVFAAIAAMFATTVVNAQNKAGINDYEYLNHKYKVEHITDKVVFSVGSDKNEYTAWELAKDGLHVGLTAGVQHFADHTVPFVGGEVMLEGGAKFPFGADINVTFAPGYYTEEADRDRTELELNLRVGPMLRFYTTKNKEWRFFVEPYFSYKQNWDYHKYENTTTTIREDEYEIVTTTDVTSRESEFIGSTKGFGLMLKGMYQPWGSRLALHFNLGFERQQRYYDTGAVWKSQAFASVGATINISSKAHKNKKFFEATGLTTAQAKKYSKDPNSGMSRR